MSLRKIGPSGRSLQEVRAAFLPVLTGRIAPAQLRNITREELVTCGAVEASNEKAYRRDYGPLVISVFDDVRAGTLSRYPQLFWDGYQGRVNSTLCFDHAFRTVLGINMDETSGAIDPKLLRENQRQFLETAAEGPQKNWDNVFAMLGLRSPYMSQYRSSPLKVFRSIYPWAFDLSKPEGKHLHAWDFKSRGMWRGHEGFLLAVEATRHTFEKHLGLVMDQVSGAIDPRFFPEPGSKFPERYTALPRNFGHNQWMAFFEAIGLGGAVFDGGNLGRELFDVFGTKAAVIWAFITSKGYIEASSGVPRSETVKREDFKMGRVDAKDFKDFDVDSSQLMLSLFTSECIDRNGMIRGGYADRIAILREHARLSETGTAKVLERLRSCALGVEITYEEESAAYDLYATARKESFRRKSSLLLKSAYEWAFDLDTEEGKHLHFYELTQVDLWVGDEGKALAQRCLRHILESHMGLKMAAPTPEKPEGVIDGRLLKKDVKSFLRANGAEEWSQVQNDQLLMVREIADDLQEVKNFENNIGRLFQWLYPWAFDLNKPEGQHLHVWEISLQFQWDEGTIKTAVKHQISEQGWTVSQFPEKVTNEWLVSAGLGGPLDRSGNSRVELLKHVYAEEFAKRDLHEAMFMGLQTSGDNKRPLREITLRPHHKHPDVFIETARYYLPVRYRGMFAKKVSDTAIGIFEKTREGFRKIGEFNSGPMHSDVRLEESQIRPVGQQ